MLCDDQLGRTVGLRVLNRVRHSSHGRHTLRNRSLVSHHVCALRLAPGVVIRQMREMGFVQVLLRRRTNKQRHCSTSIDAHKLLFNEFIVQLLLGDLGSGPQRSMCAHELVEHHRPRKALTKDLVHPFFRCSVYCSYTSSLDDKNIEPQELLKSFADTRNDKPTKKNRAFVLLFICETVRYSVVSM